jgi:hypothetical protein
MTKPENIIVNKNKYDFVFVAPILFNITLVLKSKIVCGMVMIPVASSWSNGIELGIEAVSTNEVTSGKA